MSVDDLIEKIATSMPSGAPGSLSRVQSADLVAFILKSNSFPAGCAELDSDTATLLAIRVVDHPRLRLEHHRRARRRVECRPVRQPAVVRIAAPRERRKGARHSGRQRVAIAPSPHHELHIVDVVEEERDLHAVPARERAAKREARHALARRLPPASCR